MRKSGIRNRLLTWKSAGCVDRRFISYSRGGRKGYGIFKVYYEVILLLI